jgi:hypothetical protein
MKRTRTPQYNRRVVDIRVARAKMLAMRMLEELDIDHDEWNALTIVRDLVTFHDPQGCQPKVEAVMVRYRHLVDLIPHLKMEGKV